MKFHDFPNREAWLEARRQFVGSSDASAIWNEGFQTCRECYEEKVGGVQLRITPDRERLMRVGLAMEPVIRELWLEESGREIVPKPLHRVYYGAERPFIAATPDDVVVEADGSLSPVDYKNVDNFAAGDWSHGLAPRQHMVQLHHQMLCLGPESKVGYLVGLIGGNDLQVRVVERNDRFMRAHLDRLDWFWGCVQERTPPKQKAGRRSLALFKAMHPNDDGKAIELADWMAGVIAAYEAAKVTESAAKDQKETAESQIREAMAGHTFGVAMGRAVSLKTIDKPYAGGETGKLLEQLRSFLASATVMGSDNRRRRHELLQAVEVVLERRTVYRVLNTIKQVPKGVPFVAGSPDISAEPIPGLDDPLPDPLSSTESHA